MKENNRTSRRYSVSDSMQYTKRRSVETNYGNGKRYSVCEQKMWCDGNNVFVKNDFDEFSNCGNFNFNTRICNANLGERDANKESHNVFSDIFIRNKTPYSKQTHENQQKKRVVSNLKQKLKEKMQNDKMNKPNFNNTLRDISKQLLECENKEAAELDKQHLVFLKQNILSSLFCLDLEKDQFKDIKDRAKRSAEILTLCFKKKLVAKQMFYLIFSRCDICNIIEQICIDDPLVLEILTLTIKTIINKFEKYHDTIKRKCINIIIAYIQGYKPATGLIYIIDILHSFALKDMINVEEGLFIYQNCILPLIKNDIIETFTLDNFMTICESFFIREKKNISMILAFICKEYDTGSTATKIILINLISSILLKDIETESVINILIRITVKAFESQNYIVIETMVDIYNKEESFNIILQHNHIILPLIFDALFKLSMNYWYEKGKGYILVIIQKFMRSDNVLFNICLRKYNKKRALKSVTEDYDLEFADTFFNLLSVEDEIRRERRKSVLPFEQEMKKNNFLFEKKRNGK